jgi:hypothetical protein
MRSQYGIRYKTGKKAVFAFMMLSNKYKKQKTDYHFAFRNAAL